MGSSSCSENNNRGLKGALDPNVGTVGGLTGVGKGVNSASGGGGCTPQCMAEIKTKDGELMRKVEELAKEKVQAGMCKHHSDCLLTHD